MKIEKHLFTAKKIYAFQKWHTRFVLLFVSFYFDCEFCNKFYVINIILKYKKGHKNFVS